MKYLVFFAVLLPWSVFLRAEEGEAIVAENTSEVERDIVGEAVKQLGSDRFRDREEAFQTLWEQGEGGIEALLEASQSADPEVAHRSRILLARIRTGVDLDTPWEIVEEVQKYTRGGVRAKKRALESLARQNAFVQVMRLYHFEEDENIKLECAEIANRASRVAVDQALIAGENDEAISYLEMAPQNPANNRRLAALYRFLDRLDEVIAELEEEGGQDRELFLLACYRAKGDLPMSFDKAAQLDVEGALAACSILQGDPMPYIEMKLGDERQGVLTRSYLGMLKALWKDDKRQMADLAQSMIELIEGESDDSQRALQVLLLTGHLSKAEELMREDFPDLLFSFYDTMEQPLEALACFG